MVLSCVVSCLARWAASSVAAAQGRGAVSQGGAAGGGLGARRRRYSLHAWFNVRKIGGGVAAAVRGGRTLGRCEIVKISGRLLKPRARASRIPKMIGIVGAWSFTNRIRDYSNNLLERFSNF